MSISAPETTETTATSKAIEEQISSEDLSPAAKKLTRKEQKNLEKAEAFAKMVQGEPDAEQFTVSQASTQNRQAELFETAIDIKIENFSTSARGNALFVNANLQITDGRRYGLVGPNGMDKATLLKHIANR